MKMFLYKDAFSKEDISNTNPYIHLVNKTGTHDTKNVNRASGIKI